MPAIVRKLEGGQVLGLEDSSWFEIAREGWVEYLIKVRRNHLLRKTDVNQVEEQNKLNQNPI